MSIAARSLHGVGVCLLPREENEYKPLVLRHKPLAFVSALLILTKVVALGVIALTPAQAELSTITNNRITQLTNAERTKAGLPALTTNSKLAAAAKEKGEHMLQEDYFAHISPSGVTPWFWIQKHGYTYQVAGENLAIDFTEAEDVVSAWMASPSHKENIMHPAYTETGVAVVSGEFQGGTSIVVVHMFGKPAGGSVAAEVTEPDPTPTPAPTTTPTPTPVPTSTPPPAATPVLDTTPPRTPRIALAGEGTSVLNSATITFSGDPNTTAHLLINSQLRTSVALSAEGQGVADVDLTDVPDGTIVLRVYGTDSAGNTSEASRPFTIEKDTAGPEVSSDIARFVISPQFDNARISLLPLAGEFSSARLLNGDDTVRLAGRPTLLPDSAQTQLAFTDERGNTTTIDLPSLTPSVTFEFQDSELEAPRKLSQLSRRLTASILVSMLVLLTGAILIRVRIQHPALITHASFVILLAAILFLV